MSWWSYSNYQDSKDDLQREIAHRKKKGETFVAVEAPKGNKLAVKFWGQSWQRHLESYADYESRLPRGRSYLRKGNVYNLNIDKGSVTAQVAGQSLYEVSIGISPLKPAHWQDIQKQCAGQIGSLLDLLGGKVGDSVLKVITDRDQGLFPGPKEIKINCNCLDWADLCKHAAAVLYAIGLRFDAEPELFFKLRGVNYEDLVSQAADAVAQEPAAGNAVVIADDDISAMFGIDMGGALSPEAEAALTGVAAKPEKASKKTAAKRAAKKAAKKAAKPKPKAKAKKVAR